MPKLTPNKRKLRLLLSEQKGRCFYCGNQLTETNASIDHLIPRSESKCFSDNLVVCCRSLNVFFGNALLKDKIRAVADPEFLRSISRFCLVVDRYRAK